MTGHDFEAWIEAYVGGELAPDRRQLMQAHLAGCSGCRAAVELLESIRESARGLPRSFEPSGDLWPAISARLDDRAAAGSPASSGAVEPPADAAGLRHRTWPRSRPALAAAAVALMALGVSWWVGRVPSPVTDATPGPAGEGPWIGSLLNEFGPTETAYLAAAAALESALAAERGNLEPATAAVIDRNLRILDDAIGELRAAAVASPGDPEALEFLADGYRRKVDVLRRLARISAVASAELGAEEAS